MARAIHGEAWDPFLATRCLEVLVAKAEGIPSLRAVLAVFQEINTTPLLAPALAATHPRRIALFNELLRSVIDRPVQADPTSYRDLVMRRHGRYEELAFENHARELLACTKFADLQAIDPDVRFASNLPLDTSSCEPRSGIGGVRDVP